MISNSVLRKMLSTGGKFERRLADLHFCADSKNAAKLEVAFSEIFAKFEKMEQEQPEEPIWSDCKRKFKNISE